MVIEPGTRLGSYEIVAPLGAGGIVRGASRGETLAGEIYRATDTRPNRTVAIKIISGALAGGPEGRARFQREAHAVSSLNHPHICRLFDVGEQDGVEYLHTLGQRSAAVGSGTPSSGCTRRFPTLQ